MHWIVVFALAIGASACGICADSRAGRSRHKKELLGCWGVPTSNSVFSMALLGAQASVELRLRFAGERAGTAISVMARGRHLVVHALAGKIRRNRAGRGAKVFPSDLEAQFSDPVPSDSVDSRICLGVPGGS